MTTESTDTIRQTPVLIIGGGPVGLALAAELGLRGIECLLVEQGNGEIYHPRANTINSRTMEFCRRWGIADKVRNSGAPPDFPLDILYLTSLQGHLVAHIPRPTYGGDKPLPTTPERSQRCNQTFFDPILRELADSFPSVTLRYQCRFEGFVETDKGVTATVRDVATDQAKTIEAQYLVSCCGGQSPVPKALGMQWEGTPVLSHNLNVFLRIPELWNHHDKINAAFYFFVDPEGGNQSLIEIDGNSLWRMGLDFGQEKVVPEEIDIDAKVKRWVGPDVPYEIISALPWTCRSIVADCWQKGRVFLAGDAVHQHSPQGGFGMNTGLGDAVNLAWKLAATLDGWGGPGLLESYQPERLPIARQIVHQATIMQTETVEGENSAVIADDTPEGEEARRVVGADIIRKRTQIFVSDGIVLGASYDPSPIVWDDGTPPPEKSVTTYVPTARAGWRAPHAWVSEGKSTLDLFGRGFVLLAFGSAADISGLVGAAATRNVPLEVIEISDPAIAALYERKLVLVRPDGHVAWRGDDAPADPLEVIDVVRGAPKAP
jgi:2-polyprenyl-6-methoxyphenol hydroxylase-like FAD-dependent oxidoreductase